MIYVSCMAQAQLIEYLKKKDDVTVISPSDLVYPEISSHPDIFMCRIGDEVIHCTKEEIGFSYPENIAFNAACTGKYFIHNIKHTAPRLLSAAKDKGMEIIHVKQGYSKCSIAVIDETSLITEDEGIKKSLAPYPVDVLMISKGHVRLEGFDFGFIGGTCGRVGNEIVFNGDISSHPDYKDIKEFIEKRGLEIKYFDYPLSDIGSIL